MKILLCTPYNHLGKNPGGISVWAKNIYEYVIGNILDIKFDMYSCDRSHCINENTGTFKRIFYGILDYLHFIYDIFNKVRKEHYDVVHITSTASVGTIKDLLLCCLLRKRTKVFIHYHFGRIPELATQSSMEWKMIQKTAKLAHKVIVMDNASYCVLKEQGVDNVADIPNPYSPDIERIIAELEGKVQRKKRRVLFLSRVFRKKGIYELVAACSKLNDIELRIVGPYESIDKENLMQITGNADWIDFIGPVQYDNVIEELMSSEICCIPTYTEGFPNIVMECMLSKTPLITTPVGAIPQMMDLDGIPCGIFVEPRDVDGLRDAIFSLLGNFEQQEKMTNIGAERVRRLYSVKVVAEQLLHEWAS